jgi:hypothetical protein
VRELPLVCAQVSSEAETSVLGELGKLPSREQDRVERNRRKISQLLLDPLPAIDRENVQFSTSLAFFGLKIDHQFPIGSFFNVLELLKSEKLRNPAV